MVKKYSQVISDIIEPAFLIIEKGEPQDGPFLIDMLECIVGTSPVSNIVVRSPFVSRRHVSIHHLKGSYFITDLGSRNGTLINRVPLTAHEQRKLDGGELISLANGEVLLRFRKSDDTLPQSRLSMLNTEIVVDGASRDVTLGGKTLDPPLSRKEFDVLELLYRNKGRAVDRDEIAKSGWPERSGGDIGNQEIEQCISRIRRRIEMQPSKPELIVTLRGYGYKML